MKLVIKDNKVIATHDNNQDVERLYDDCIVIIVDSFSGKIGDDYEITKEDKIRRAMTIRDAVIDSVTNSVLLDQLQLAAGLITQSVFDSRKTAKTAIYSKAVDDFYTTTGLTKPTTIGA